MKAGVVLCGLGHLGWRVAALFEGLGVPLTIVTEGSRAEWLRRASAAGIRVHHGDARDEELVREAGLEHAVALVCATNSDMVNIEAALDARAARPRVRLVMRVFDPNLASSLERTLGNARAFGASAIAGPQLAWAALGEDVLGTFDWEGVSYVIAALPEGSAPQAAAPGVAVLDDDARGRPLLVAESEAFVRLRGLEPRRGQRRGQRAVRRAFVRIWRNAPLALRRALGALAVLVFLSVVIFQAVLELSISDALYFVVTTVTTVGYGDITPREGPVWLKLYACVLMLAGSAMMAILFSLVTDFVVGEKVRRLSGARADERSGHVVVVGAGRAGYRTAEQLRRVGVDVVTIDLDAEAPLAASARLEGVLVAGDARLPETLAMAGVQRARAVIAATGDDAVNLAIALAAHRAAPTVRTVARLFDDEFARKSEKAGLIHAALSTSRAAAPYFVAAALFDDVVAALVEGGALIALRRSTESPGAPDTVTLASSAREPLVLRVERKTLGRGALDRR
jgi:Trk K+ transport system NAD-binding subunit